MRGKRVAPASRLNHDGNPDTWPGAGTTAPIDQAYAEGYLGAGGNWVDVYRFKYSVSNVNAGRFLNPSIVGLSAQVMTGLQLVGGVWQPTLVGAPASQTSSANIEIVFGGAPNSGACCDEATGACTATIGCICDSYDFYEGRSCSPNPCPQPGACCLSSGACTFSIYERCLLSMGGHWTAGGAGVPCSPNPCPQLGICCSPVSGQCTFVFQSACAGIWPTGGACSPNPCPQTGACCQSASCALVSISACPTPGQFHGIGSTCGTPANLTTCCPANFNAVSGLTVQDIFDFLGAWFASDPRADFDHDSVLAVLDISGFLHDWFQGCS